MINLEVGTTYNMTPAEVFNDATMRPQDWTLSPSNVIPGVVVNYAGLTGTPTTAGNWTIYAAQLDDYGDPMGERAIAVTVTAPVVVDPDPGTNPEPTVTGTPAKVLAFLGVPVTDESLALAEQHTRVVTTFVRNYCHGNGFRVGTTVYNQPVSVDIEDVIVSATARYLFNPQQASRQQLGDQSILYASLEGFTLAEKAVLHRYRRRTA